MDKGQIVISEKNKQELDYYPPSTWPITFFVVLMLVATGLGGGGLALMKTQQQSQAEELNQQAKAIEQQMQDMDKSKGLLTTSLKINSAVKTYNEFVKSDLNWQEFLNNVKDKTLKEVTYTAFAVDRPKSSFRVDGVAPSYRIVAEQLNTLSLESNFESVKLRSTILRPQSPEKSRVAFSFEIKPKDEAFQSKKKVTDPLDTIKNKPGDTSSNTSSTTNPATTPVPATEGTGVPATTEMTTSNSVPANTTSNTNQ